MQFPVDEVIAMEGRADAVSWDLSEFDVYRVRMPYRIILSDIRMFFHVD